jgi:hypothetical protein
MPDNHSSQSQNLMPNWLTGDALDRDKMQAIGAAE